MKTLVFYLKMGGGHKSMAYNYEESFTSKSNSTEVLDGLNGLPESTQNSASKSYIFLLKYNFLWFFFIYMERISFVSPLFYTIFRRVTLESFEKIILQKKPDKIVSTFYFFTLLGAEVARKHKLKINFETVVCDPFTPEPIWFYDKNCKYLVFSQRAKEIALKNGVLENKIEILEPIVAKKFENALNEKEILELKAELSLNSKEKTILIASGGEGLKDGFKIFKILLKSKDNYNIILVCGRDEGLHNQASKLLNQVSDNVKKVLVYGFVDNMKELMSISDLIITKAGPSTVLEIASLKKKMLITSYIWPQEKGNLDYILENGLGEYEPKINKIEEKVKSLLF